MSFLQRLIKALQRRSTRRQTTYQWSRVRELAIDEKPTIRLESINHALHLTEDYSTEPMLEAVKPTTHTEPIEMLSMTEHFKTVQRERKREIL